MHETLDLIVSNVCESAKCTLFNENAHKQFIIRSVERESEPPSHIFLLAGAGATQSYSILARAGATKNSSSSTSPFIIYFKHCTVVDDEMIFDIGRYIMIFENVKFRRHLPKKSFWNFVAWNGKFQKS